MDISATERVLLFAHEESTAALLPAPCGAASGRLFCPRPPANEMLADVTQAKARIVCGAGFAFSWVCRHSDVAAWSTRRSRESKPHRGGAQPTARTRLGRPCPANLRLGSEEEMLLASCPWGCLSRSSD